MGAPGAAAVCPSVLVIERSAAGKTVVVAEAVLLAAPGSDTFDDTRAVLVIVPAAFGVTTMLTVALAAFAREPRVQPTCDSAWKMTIAQVPWLGVADTKVAPTGTSSETRTPVAVAGPPFVTVTV